MILSNRIFVAFLCLTLFTCKKDPTISAESSHLIDDEMVQDAILSEIDVLVWYALQSNASISADGPPLHADDRANCSDIKITYTDILDDKSAGNVVIDFGTSGCTDKKGNNRKGKIEISWANGKWFMEGSTQTIMLNNYSINNILVTGTKHSTCMGGSLQSNFFYIGFDISADYTLTWPDMSTASRTVSERTTWARSVNENQFLFGNSSSNTAASGINRHNQKYTVSFGDAFMYSDSCTSGHKLYLPIRGSKNIIDQTTSKSILVQSNRGYCTNAFAIFADGVKETLKVNDDFTW